MIRFGIVGGGNVAAIHRRAAALDHTACLSAACLSRNQAANHRLGAAWQIPEDRLYDYCEEMAEKLESHGIAVRAGLHCAPLAHASAGTLESGTVRVSYGYRANPEQTGNLLLALAKESGQM